MVRVCILGTVLLAASSASAQDSETEEGTQGQPPAALPAWEVSEEPVMSLPDLMRRGNALIWSQFRRVSPIEGGAFWLGLIVTLVVGLSYSRFQGRRNIALMALLLPGLLMTNTNALSSRFGDPVVWSLFTWLQRALFVVLLGFVAWGCRMGFRAHVDSWKPGVEGRRLRTLVCCLLLLCVIVAIILPLGDASEYVNLGTQRFRETGGLPYTDPWLVDGAAAAYGPAFYLWVLPFQFLINPSALNPDAEDPVGYNRGSRAPVRLASVLLLFLAAWGLFQLVSDRGSVEMAWGAVALFVGSASVLGSGGGGGEPLSGVRVISETGPLAMVMLSLAMARSRPLWSGFLLGCSMAFGVFTIFFAPPLLAWSAGRKGGWTRVMGGMVLSGVLFLAVLFVWSGPADGLDSVAAFHEQVISHQTHTTDSGSMVAGYGDSPFGFWGTHPGLKAWWLGPFFSSLPLLTPVFLLLLLVVAWCTWRARGVSLPNLCLGLGAIAVMVQIVRPHSSGTHLLWYLPLFLVGVLLGGAHSETKGSDDAVPAD